MSEHSVLIAKIYKTAKKLGNLSGESKNFAQVGSKFYSKKVKRVEPTPQSWA